MSQPCHNLGASAITQTDLQRVRSDLATMKKAAGVGLPIGGADIWLSIAWAVAGLPLMARTAVAPVEREMFGVLLGVPALVVLALSAWVARKYHRDKGKAPIRWEEHRFQWITAGVGVVLLGGFVIWGLARGLSPQTLTTTAVFTAGLAMLILPIVDHTRMFYLGWAVSTMLFAVVAPQFGYRYLGVCMGGWLLLSGLTAALIMGWQLRTGATEHAAD